MIFTFKVKAAEHLYYWLPRYGASALAWVSLWTFAATRTDPSVADATSRYIATTFVYLGLASIVLLPVSSYKARHFKFLISNQRIIVFNERTSRYRFVAISDIDNVILRRGFRPDFGTVIVEAGEVDAPDAMIPMRIRLVGIKGAKNLYTYLQKRHIHQ